MSGEISYRQLDKPRVKAAVREFFAAIGESPDCEDLLGTSDRIARACEEIFGGMQKAPNQHLLKQFHEPGNENSVANSCGSLLLVAIFALVNLVCVGGDAVGATMMTVVASTCALPWNVTFGRNIMCNFLVCLAVWMGFAGSSVADKFLVAVAPVCACVACGFGHCVANMFFIPMGMAAVAGRTLPAEGVSIDVLGWAGLVSNLSAATLGYLVGGAVLFSGMYWLAFGRER